MKGDAIKFVFLGLFFASFVVVVVLAVWKGRGQAAAIQALTEELRRKLVCAGCGKTDWIPGADRRHQGLWLAKPGGSGWTMTPAVLLVCRACGLAQTRVDPKRLADLPKS